MRLSDSQAHRCNNFHFKKKITMQSNETFLLNANLNAKNLGVPNKNYLLMSLPQFYAQKRPLSISVGKRVCAKISSGNQLNDFEENVYCVRCLSATLLPKCTKDKIIRHGKACFSIKLQARNFNI
jgi:hypothetical protein